MGAQTNPNKTKINIDCTLDERAYIKMLAAKEHTTISEYMLSHVRAQFPKREKIPNEETLAAMREADDDLGMEFECMEDFWKEMGIDRNA